MEWLVTVEKSCHWPPLWLVESSLVVLLGFFSWADVTVLSASDSSLETTDSSELSAKIALNKSKEGLATCIIIRYKTISLSRASLAQSAARQSHNLKVVSSSLTGGTFFFFFLFPVSPLELFFACHFSVTLTIDSCQPGDQFSAYIASIFSTC